MAFITLLYLWLSSIIHVNNSDVNIKIIRFVNSNDKNSVSVYQKDTINKEGKSIYIKYCLTCHQSEGNGVPQMYPPIQKSNWVNGDKNKLIKILLNGSSGEIEVNDEFYDQTMPKFDYLTNEQLSKVLTYIRENFGNKASPVTIKEVIEIRKPN